MVLCIYVCCIITSHSRIMHVVCALIMSCIYIHIDTEVVEQVQAKETEFEEVVEEY